MKIVLTLDLTVHGNISDTEVLDVVMANNGLPGVFLPPEYDSDADPGWVIEVESVTGEIAPVVLSAMSEHRRTGAPRATAEATGGMQMRSNARIKRLMDELPNAVPDGYALFMQAGFRGSSLLLYEEATNRIEHAVFIPGADGGDPGTKIVDGIEYIDCVSRPPTPVASQPG